MRYYRLGRILTEGKGKSRVPLDRMGFSDTPDHLKRFVLSDADLNTHLLVTGTTGGGKSRLLWQIFTEHLRNNRGCSIVEPGDLIDDLLGYCARRILDTGDTSFLEKIHLVELSPFQMARHDPFRFFYPYTFHPELRETIYRSWQQTKVQSFAEVYQWKQGQSTDFQGMPRLQRLFLDVFTALSTLVGNRRLSAGDAHLLVDLGHPEHFRVYERLKPHLPREIVSDFEIIHSFKSVRDLRTETESFVNRIRSTHGLLLKEMLSSSGDDPVINLYDIIQKGHFLFVKTGRTPFASNDQNNALASIFIHDLIDTVFITPREFRKEYTLIIDEAHKYVRAGIGDLARTARKFKLSLILATTDLVSLKNGDLDLTPELLSVVNTVIAFRMSWPEDIQRLAEFLYAQNIDFTELMHEVERRAGPLWIPVDEWSETYNKQSGKGTTGGTTVVDAQSAQQSASQMAQTSKGITRDRNGQPLSTTQGASQANGLASSNGTTHSNAVQQGFSSTESEGMGVTINHKLVHIEKIVREIQNTGMLEASVADQLARFAQRISGQSSRQATARIREGKAVEFISALVKDPFMNPEAHARAVEWMKRKLYQTHAYYFTPTLDLAEDDRRIQEFLSGTPDRQERRPTPRTQSSTPEENPLA